MSQTSLKGLVHAYVCVCVCVCVCGVDVCVGGVVG